MSVQKVNMWSRRVTRKGDRLIGEVVFFSIPEGTKLSYSTGVSAVLKYPRVFDVKTVRVHGLSKPQTRVAVAVWGSKLDGKGIKTIAGLIESHLVSLRKP